MSANGREELSGAAILLFGKEPQQYFKRARVRFIRYEGTEARVGAQMNVVKDKIFEGRILQIVEQSIDFVRDQIKEHTYLGREGKFVTESEYPEFAWKEIIVNAIAHRDYSIKGTDIQIKMFDDHFTVESPGTLPGIVRINNMRQVHFSRNPKIAEVLHATLKNRKYVEHAVDTTQVATQVITQVDISDKITAYCKEPRKKSEIMAYCGYKNAKSFTKKYLKPLMDQGLITMTIPDKPNSQNQRYITTVK